MAAAANTKLDDVYKQINCCVAGGVKHVVQEPKKFTCGGNACKACLNGKTSVNCSFCNAAHDADAIAKATPNDDEVNKLIDSNLPELTDSTVKELQESLPELDDAAIAAKTKEHFEGLEAAVCGRVRELIDVLEEHRRTLKTRLAKAKEALQKTVECDETKKLREKIEEIRNKKDETVDTEAFMRNHQILKDSQKVLQTLTKQLNECEFIESDYEIPPAEECIGVLEIKFAAENLMEAINKNDLEEVDYWVDVATPTSLPEALRKAAELGFKDAIQKLIENNVKLNEKDEAGRTALTIAANKGHKRCVDLLLANQADVNIQDNEGNSALMEAAKGGFREIVEILLENSADTKARNKQDLSAAELAGINNHTEVAQLITDKAAN